MKQEPIAAPETKEIQTFSHYFSVKEDNDLLNYQWRLKKWVTVSKIVMNVNWKENIWGLIINWLIISPKKIMKGYK